MRTVTIIPRGLPLARADLDAMPDDGHRYELVDGSLIVTPAPSYRHQTMVGELFLLLRLACPAGLRVLTAPFDVVLARDTVMQPDVLVSARDSFTSKDLPTTPLLVVEVLSPSTRLIDLNLKRGRFENAGCPSYWVVNPEGPSLTAWELRAGAYVKIAHVTGREEYTARAPYDVTVQPAALLD